MLNQNLYQPVIFFFCLKAIIYLNQVFFLNSDPQVQNKTMNLGDNIDQLITSKYLIILFLGSNCHKRGFSGKEGFNSQMCHSSP